ncbi:hypothetical protein V9T40_008118 [Parthenolecanium corni]|uniref:Uncharacterized protein n=1 Tax=Parthenolecanium corni TaxID=536013 RepID=A0AAN9TNS4_9HEMI
MADVEFEEFRKHFEQLPQHIRASARSYTLVHDIAIDDDQFLANSSKEFKDYEVKCDQVRQSKSNDPFK